MTTPSSTTVADVVLVRRERAADADAVRRVHAAAFTPVPGGGEPLEAALVDALRTSGAWIDELSWVAVDDGAVVGHVVCTRAHVGDAPVLGLGPLGVRPSRQRTGVGTALVHAVLGAADALGEPIVALLGSPAYYARFGFVRSTVLGIDAPDPAWGEHFQVRPLTTHHAALTGRFRYAAPFDDVD